MSLMMFKGQKVIRLGMYDRQNVGRAENNKTVFLRNAGCVLLDKSVMLSDSVCFPKSQAAGSSET